MLAVCILYISTKWAPLLCVCVRDQPLQLAEPVVHGQQLRVPGLGKQFTANGGLGFRGLGGSLQRVELPRSIRETNEHRTLGERERHTHTERGRERDMNTETDRDRQRGGGRET